MPCTHQSSGSRLKVVLLCFTHRDDLPVPFPSLVPNPHLPLGERVGSDDDTKPSLPPVLAVSKAEDGGNKAHQQVGCILRLEKACSLASNPRLPPPSNGKLAGGLGWESLHVNMLGPDTILSSIYGVYYMLNQFESLCADLTNFCLVSLFRVLALT